MRLLKLVEIFLFFFSINASAQSWNTFQILGNEGSDAIDLMASLPDGTFIAAGTFTETITLGNYEFTARGRQDLWLAKFDQTGNIDWALQGGSEREDENADLKISPNGSIYWSGTFWNTAQFGNLTLAPSFSQKSIFIIKINIDGIIENATSLAGRGSKDIGEMEFDATNHLYFIGNFSDTIQLADTLFLAAENDVFISKMDENFNLQWWQQIDGTKTSKGIGLGILSSGEIMVGGHFEGTMILATDTIATRTPDEDLFYAKFDSAGQPIFLRRAGGVYPAFCKSIEIDEADNFYLTGNHRGVIKVDENLQIETQGLNDNFFLFSLDAKSDSRWGKSLGSQENDGIEDTFISDNELFLAGNYAAEMTIGQSIIPFEENLFNNGFFASFETKNGDLNWIQTTQGSDFILGKTITEWENQVLVGGDFSIEIAVEDQVFISKGFFDFFVGKINPKGSVSTSERIENQLYFYPNPTTGILNFRQSVKNHELILYSITGSKIETFQNQSQIDISSLPSGLYFFKIDSQYQLLVKQ